jgi:hypothetical protein
MSSNLDISDLENDSKIIKDPLEIENRKAEVSKVLLNDQPRMASLGNSIKAIFEDCLDNTSLMGLPNVVRENSHLTMKIMWLCAFLAFLGVCISYLVQTFNTYYSYPTYWAIDNIQERPTNFPAVSICNSKLLDRSKASTQAWIASNQAMLTIDPSTPGLSNFYEWNWITNYQTRVVMAYDATLNSSAKKSLGYQIEDMLLSCELNYAPCNSSDFSYFYHYQYGNCYTWNGILPPKQTALSNRDGGLALELYLGDPSVDTYYNDDDGLYMSIHNQSEIPFSRNPVIKIAAGTSNSIIIKKSFTQKLQPPAGSCMADGFSSELYDFMNNTLKVNYTQEYCFSLCITKLFKSSCNCTHLGYPPISLNSTLRA